MCKKMLGSVPLASFIVLALIGLADGAEVQPTKVKAGEVVNKLRGAKIISIQDVDKINAIDQEGMKGVWGNSPVNEYDRDYPRRLKEFLGLELVIVRSGELLEEMGNVDKDALEKLADQWIREATEMKNVTRSDVLRSARLYWGFKALLRNTRPWRSPTKAPRSPCPRKKSWHGLRWRSWN